MVKRTKTEEKEKIIKEEKTANEESKADNNEAKQEKQILMIFLVGICIIAIFIGFFIFMRSLNNFTYEGIKFTKNSIGKIPIYTAKIPLVDSYGKIINYTTADFRNDPRTLKDIEVKTSEGIIFQANKLAYISYNTDMKICEYNGLAAANLGIFLTNAGISIKGALDDKSYENDTKIPYVNCNTNPNNTVILVKNGNETQIEQTAKNCYEIVSKDCDILKATEKFEITILEQYMSGFS